MDLAIHGSMEQSVRHESAMTGELTVCFWAYFVEKVGFGAGLWDFEPLQDQPKISARVSAKIVFYFSQ